MRLSVTNTYFYICQNIAFLFCIKFTKLNILRSCQTIFLLNISFFLYLFLIDKLHRNPIHRLGDIPFFNNVDAKGRLLRVLTILEVPTYYKKINSKDFIFTHIGNLECFIISVLDAEPRRISFYVFLFQRN